MRIRHAELAALIGIKLWNEVALMFPDYEKFAEEQRLHIYNDLFMDIECRYSVLEVGPRFGNLLLMLRNLDVSFYLIE
jgi:hypothetical protein